MKKNWKRIVAVVAALVVVVSVGYFSADALLHATDAPEGEIMVEEPTEAVIREVIVPAETVIVTNDGEDVAEVTPAEDGQTADEQVAEEQPENPAGAPKRSVTITSNLDGQKTVAEGTEFVMKANLKGFEGVEYTVQWQRSLDGQNWENVEGATSLTYSVVLTDETDDYVWSVVITTPDGE